MKSLAVGQSADAALDVLSHFRVEFYDCLYTRADALFELTDAVLCSDGPVTSLVELTLTAEHRRGHVQDGRAELPLLVGAGRALHVGNQGSGDALAAPRFDHRRESRVATSPAMMCALGDPRSMGWVNAHAAGSAIVPPTNSVPVCDFVARLPRSERRNAQRSWLSGRKEG